MQSLPFFTQSSKAAFCCLDVDSIVERYSLSGFIPEVVVLECCQRDSDLIALEETIKQWLAVAMYCNVTVWVRLSHAWSRGTRNDRKVGKYRGDDAGRTHTSRGRHAVKERTIAFLRKSCT